MIAVIDRQGNVIFVRAPSVRSANVVKQIAQVREEQRER